MIVRRKRSSRSAAEPLRVLLVLCDLRAGGAEMTALQLVRSLAGRGYQFTVASVRGGGVLADDFRRAGADVREGVCAKGRRADPLALWRIFRILRTARIDVMIVVDVTRNAMFYGLAGSILCGPWVRRVVWCKSVPGKQAGQFIAALKRYRKVGLVDAIICTSMAQRGRLVDLGLPAQKIGLIRNGVELADQSVATPAANLPAGVPHDRPLIVQVANYMPDKDHETLIKAAAQLAQRGRKFHLLLIGRDTDGPGIRAMVEQQAVGPHVTLLGHRTDIRQILARSTLFVLSTRSEVFSVATLEAMAAGLPLVVSDIPAFSEMFTSGREGLKVRPQDPDALADALAGLLGDDDLRRHMAAASRLRAERFSLERMADNFDRLLRTLAKR